ncbi:MAG: DUF4180 domain-containing protein [Spirochaetales bacterium]|nr:DUF4180 domain-containing protein [Spirochaetales bacterium]
MEFRHHEHGSTRVAELVHRGVAVREADDVLDLMANAGARALLVREEHLDPSFWKLGSGLAGEVLQKFSTYRMRFAVVGEFSKYPGKPLRDFIRESNETGEVIFVPTLEAALERFGSGSAKVD